MPLPSIGLIHPDEKAMFDDPESSAGSGVIGRLAPGAKTDVAKAEIDGLSRQFRATLSKPAAGFTLHSTRPFDAEAATVARQIPVLGTSLAALLLVMLLACANVGNLLLARGMTRRRETAIRLSLGATWKRVARQFMTEALLLAVRSPGAIGLWIGWFVPVVLVRTFPQVGQIRTSLLAPDLAVFSVALILVLLATVIAGLAPALRLSRPACCTAPATGIPEIVAPVGFERRSWRPRLRSPWCCSSPPACSREPSRMA